MKGTGVGSTPEQRYRGRLRWLKLAIYVAALAAIGLVEAFYYFYMAVPWRVAALDYLASASVAAILIEICFFVVSRNMRDLQREKERIADQNRELMAVYETATLLGSTLDLGEVLELALERIPAGPTTTSVIGLIEPGRDKGSVVASKGPFQTQVKGLEVSAEEVPSTLGDLLHRQRQPVVLSDLRAVARSQYRRLAQRLPVLEQTRSLVIVPLVGREATIGYLLLADTQKYVPTDSELKMLTTIARQVAGAVENARLFGTLARAKQEWEATVDALQEGVFVVDIEYTILRANRAFAMLAGADPKSIVGRKCHEVFEACPEPPADCYLLCMETPEQRLAVERTAKVDGRLLHVYHTCLYDALGAPTGLVHTVQDITERQASQEQLVHHTRETELRNAVLRRASQSLDLSSSLDAILEELMPVVGAEAGWAQLLSEDTAEPGLCVGRGGPQREAADEPTGRVGEGFLGFLQTLSEPTVMDESASGFADLVKSYGAAGAGWKWIAVVPLRSKDRLLGGLGLAGSRPPTATYDLDSLRDLASSLSMVVENSLLYERTHREAEQWAWLAETTTQLSSSLDLSQTLETAVNGVAAVVSSPTATVSIALLDEEQGVLRVVAAQGPHEEAARQANLTVSEWEPEYQQLFLEEQKELLFPHTSQAPEGLRALPLLADSQGWMAIPLVAKGQVVGAITIGDAVPLTGNRRPPRVLRAFANAVAIAVENTRLYETERTRFSKLEELDELKSGFLQTISHELRTPLASLKTSVDLLRELSDQSPVSEHHSRLLSNVNRSVSRLDRLVSDLADLSSLENASLTLHPEQCSIPDLVAESAGMMVPLIASKKQSFNVDVPDTLPDVVVDRHRFGQILGNLLSNANKFSPHGASIELKVHQEEDQVVFAVRDGGPGIPAEEQQRIFEPFYRAAPGRRAGGTGLGLAIAKSLVDLHRGRIWVDSQVGEGSTFYFSLPVE